MNRRYDGIDIIKKIKNGELKKDDIIINEVGWKYKYDGEDTFFDIDDNAEMTISEIISHTFAILSEYKEIDIQSIEELNAKISGNVYDTKASKINEIIKAIKQLDKQINK